MIYKIVTTVCSPVRVQIWSLALRGEKNGELEYMTRQSYLCS